MFLGGAPPDPALVTAFGGTSDAETSVLGPAPVGASRAMPPVASGLRLSALTWACGCCVLSRQAQGP